MLTTNAHQRKNATDNTAFQGDSTAEHEDGVLSQLSDKAQEIGSNVAQKTDETISSVGGKITTFADSIRDAAPDKGTIANAAGNLADGIQTSGQYLKDHGVGDMAEDVTGLIRKHPVRSLWIGIGIGVLLGTALSKK